MSLQLAIKIAESMPIVKGRQRICAIIVDKRGESSQHRVKFVYKEPSFNATIFWEGGQAASMFCSC